MSATSSAKAAAVNAFVVDAAKKIVLLVTAVSGNVARPYPCIDVQSYGNNDTGGAKLPWCWYAGHRQPRLNIPVCSRNLVSV